MGQPRRNHANGTVSGTTVDICKKSHQFCHRDPSWIPAQHCMNSKEEKCRPTKPFLPFTSKIVGGSVVAAL